MKTIEEKIKRKILDSRQNQNILNLDLTKNLRLNREASNSYKTNSKQRTHQSIDRFISTQRKVWNSMKNSPNKLEKISDRATEVICGINPYKFRNTSFPIKSSYLRKTTKKEVNEEYQDDFEADSEDEMGFDVPYQEIEPINVSNKPLASTMDYSSCLKSHCQRKSFDKDRILYLSRPKVCLGNPKRKRKRRGYFLINKKLNLSYELPSNKKEKLILLNSAKASVYGVDVRDVPLLDKDISQYSYQKTKDKLLSQSANFIKRLQKKRGLSLSPT